MSKLCKKLTAFLITGFLVAGQLQPIGAATVSENTVQTQEMAEEAAAVEEEVVVETGSQTAAAY